MSNYEVKDAIALARSPNVKGTIVAVLKSGKYKVLLDRDWQTGRTFIYSAPELCTAN